MKRTKGVIFGIVLVLLALPMVFATDIYSNSVTNPDGTTTIELFNNPVNYLDDKGEFQPIDINFKSIDILDPMYWSGYAYSVENGLYKAYFKESLKDEYPILIIDGKEETKYQMDQVGYYEKGTFYPLSTSFDDVKVVADKNAITYYNAITGVDIVYRYLETKLKEDIIVRDTSFIQTPDKVGATEDAYFMWATKMDGSENMFNQETGEQLSLPFELTGVGIDFKDVDGKEVTHSLNPVYTYDNATQVKVTYAVVKDGDGNLLLLSGIPYKELLNLKTPITFDPTTTLQPGASGEENGLTLKNPTLNEGTLATFFAAGYNTGGNLWRGVIRFNLSSIPAGSNITYANYSCYEYTQINYGGVISIHKLTQSAWTETGSTWNTYDGTNAWTTAGGDYNAAQESNITTSNAAQWYTWRVTSSTQSYLDGINYGWLTKAVNEATGQKRITCYSSEEATQTTLRPKMMITYTPLVNSLLNVSGRTSSGAVINWSTTGVLSNTSVNYGTTKSLGTKSQTNDAVTKHSRTLSGLVSGTRYFFNITSCRAKGCAVNGTFNFTTTGSPPSPPAVFSILPVANTNYNVTNVVTIKANVTDAQGVSQVKATITRPGGSSTITLKAGSAPKYNNTFVIPNVTGRYNVTFFANDTLNSINNTVTTYFNVFDYIKPLVTFDRQRPADITTTSLVGSKVNVTYNITDNVALKLNTIKLYYFTNQSDTNCLTFTNGTKTSCGYQPSTYTSNISRNFLWRLDDGDIYPVRQNLPITTFETATHTASALANANQYIKVRIYNISTNRRYGLFEFMAMNSSAASSLRVYYCNSTYLTGNPATSTACTQIATLASGTSYNHIDGLSKHHVVSFPINTTTKKIGTVTVSPTSFFLFRGASSGTWNVYKIANTTRPDQMRITTNNGNSWSNLAGTVDAHLHQYNGTARFWYYACANDTSNNKNCTTARSDLIDLGNMPPTAPNIYRPLPDTINARNITINYTTAQSPNNYAIKFYNISLYSFPTQTFVKSIKSNNSLNLGYVWNSVGTTDGSYIIGVRACDVNNLCDEALRSNITVDNTNPAVSGILPTGTYAKGSTVTISANVTDLSGISTVRANITNPLSATTTLNLVRDGGNKWNNTFSSTTNTGIYTIKILANDTVNNKNWTRTQTFTIDTTKPLVTAPIPIAGTNYNVTNTVTLKVNVTDNIGVSQVVANIFRPVLGLIQKVMTFLSGITWQTTFTVPNVTGRYNVTYVANDTSNNINNTVKTYFNSNDYIKPRVFDLFPRAGTVFKDNTLITFSANVTDNVGVSKVYMNVTKPNGQVIKVNLTLDGGAKYNNTWNAGTLHGVYNVRAIANDTSNRINSSITTWFKVNENPLVTILYPLDGLHDAAHEPFISAAVTDSDGVDTVWVNLTGPGGVRRMNMWPLYMNDNFSTNTIGTDPTVAATPSEKWYKFNITSAGQICRQKIENGKMNLYMAGDGSPKTDTVCDVVSSQRVGDNFDINVSFNVESLGEDTELSFYIMNRWRYSIATHYAFVDISNYTGYPKSYDFYSDDGNISGYENSITTSDTSGKFRMRKTGTQLEIFAMNTTSNKWMVGLNRTFNCDEGAYIGLMAFNTKTSFGTVNGSFDNLFTADGAGYRNNRLQPFVPFPLVGLWNFTIVANDTLGGINNTEHNNFTLAVINDRPFGLFIYSPTNGEFVQGSSYKVQWSKVYDEENDNIKFNITLLNSDGTNNKTIVDNYGNLNTTEYTWDTTTTADGTYSLRVTAYETSTPELYQTSTELYPWTFDIGNAYPDVGPIQPTTAKEDTPINWNTTANQVGGSISACEFSADDVFKGFMTLNNAAIDWANYTYTFNTIGTHEIKVSCNNSVNLRTTYRQNVSITYLDLVKPYWNSSTETIASNSSYFNPRVEKIYQFVTTWFDDVVVDKVWIVWDSIKYFVTGVGNVFTFDRANLTTGTHTYKWYANDSSGNTNSTPTYQYIVKGLPNYKLNGSLISVNSSFMNATFKAYNLSGGLAYSSNSYFDYTFNGDDVYNLEVSSLYDTSVNKFTLYGLYNNTDYSNPMVVDRIGNIRLVNTGSLRYDSLTIELEPVTSNKIFFKCGDYNTTSLACNGDWRPWYNIVPGLHNYSFAPGDPALQELNGTFFEDFESTTFTTNNWTVDAGWSVSLTNGIAGYSARKAGASTDSKARINISTAGYSDINISFDRKTVNLEAGDYLAVEWYNGTGWIQLESYFGPDSVVESRNYTLPSTAENNPLFALRFICNMDQPTERCVFDNVFLNGVLNTAPKINNNTIRVNGDLFASIDPIEASVNPIQVSFNATDANFNLATAYINVSKGSVSKYKSGAQLTSTCTAPLCSFNTSINMDYFDQSGIWNIEVGVTDTFALSAKNQSSFTYNTLKALQVLYAPINFSTIGYKTSSISNNLTIKNTGNVQYNVNLTASNLTGQTNPIKLPLSLFKWGTTINPATPVIGEQTLTSLLSGSNQVPIWFKVESIPGNYKAQVYNSTWVWRTS